ncbi:MAG: nascent polypeptide-associated complex protein [Candidatus Micrarchaeia archaeon]
MQQILKQMGVKSRQLNASRVIIECEGTNIIIENPQILEMEMRGQKNYSISGDVHEEQSLSNEDIELVIKQTGATREEAISALKKEGDVASAIISLKDREKQS